MYIHVYVCIYMVIVVFMNVAANQDRIANHCSQTIVLGVVVDRLKHGIV